MDLICFGGTAVISFVWLAQLTEAHTTFTAIYSKSAISTIFPTNSLNRGIFHSSYQTVIDDNN